MKFVLALVFILGSLSCLSQQKINVLYIDAHENLNTLNLIISKANKIIEEFDADDHTLLYISNGNMSVNSISPSEFEDKLNSLIKGGLLSSPEYLDDVYEINNILLNNGWISDLINDEQSLNISFQFMVEEANYYNTNFEKKFINFLLLSNNLIDSSVLSPSCSVKLIFDKSNKSWPSNRRNKFFNYEYL